jgi:hypothetical protein
LTRDYREVDGAGRGGAGGEAAAVFDRDEVVPVAVHWWGGGALVSFAGKGGRGGGLEKAG